MTLYHYKKFHICSLKEYCERDLNDPKHQSLIEIYKCQIEILVCQYCQGFSPRSFESDDWSIQVARQIVQSLSIKSL